MTNFRLVPCTDYTWDITYEGRTIATVPNTYWAQIIMKALQRTEQDVLNGLE